MDEHQRQRNIRNCALYYERHRDQFLKRKVLRGVKSRGAVPYRESCRRFGISVAEIMDAYQCYVANNEPNERSRVRYNNLLRGWC
jgi:hypothetical protein